MTSKLITSICPECKGKGVWINKVDTICGQKIPDYSMCTYCEGYGNLPTYVLKKKQWLQGTDLEGENK